MSVIAKYKCEICHKHRSYVVNTAAQMDSRRLVCFGCRKRYPKSAVAILKDWERYGKVQWDKLERVVVVAVAVLMLGALAVTAKAEDLPNAPEPGAAAGAVQPAYIASTAPASPAHSATAPTRADWTLLAADAAVRLNDTLSTTYALSHGWHEKFLPDAISHHEGVMAAYSSAVVAVDWMVARRLERRGHRRWARAWMLAEVAQDGWWGGRNWAATPTTTTARTMLPRKLAAR